MDDDLPPTARVYGNLIVAFRRAHVNSDRVLANRIDGAILVLKEMWPQECAMWEAMFSDNRQTDE